MLLVVRAREARSVSANNSKKSVRVNLSCIVVSKCGRPRRARRYKYVEPSCPLERAYRALRSDALCKSLSGSCHPLLVDHAWLLRRSNATSCADDPLIY